MKKIKGLLIGLLAALIAVGSSGCTVLVPPSPSSGSSQPQAEEHTWSFTVQYDYGQHVEDRATLLLSGTIPFFDPEEYGVSPLIAGEKVTVSYTGELRILESYPSQAVLDGVTIEKVEKTDRAYITDCHCVDGKLFDPLGNWFSNLTKEDIPEYVIHEDSTFTPFDELAEGTKLYASYVLPEQENADVNPDMTRIPPTALYSYHPKAEQSESSGSETVEGYQVDVAWANWSGDKKIEELALNDPFIFSSIHYPIYKCETAAELAQFKTDFKGVFSMSSSWDEIGSFETMAAKYTETFFEENTLLLVYVATTSCTPRYGVERLSRTGERVNVYVVQTNDPGFGDEAMGGWLLGVSVPKESLQGVTEFDATFVGYDVQ